MPRRKPDPVTDDAPQLPGLAVARRRAGRAERAVQTSLTAARAAGRLETAEHAAAAAALRGMARALDTAERQGAAYVSGQVARTLMESLDRMGMLPEPAATTADLFAQLDAVTAAQPPAGDP